MNKIKLLVGISLFAFSAAAQNTLTLDNCINAAYAHLQFDEQSKLLNDGRTYAMDGSNYLNLPSLQLDGNATIQNEQIGFALPNTPEAPLNFNRLLINFNQAIYNGNITAKKKLIDSLSYDEQQQALEIDKIKVKSQVIGVYATLLVVRTNKDILQGHVKVLDKKYNQLQGAVEAGAATSSKLQVLEAERLKLQQKVDELSYTEHTLVKTLGNYMGTELADDVSLEMPTPQMDVEGALNRPELSLIDTKMEGLEAREDLLAAARLPYVGVFGNVGLGYPGYNIFDNTIRPMILGGIAVKWNIWDWNKTKNEKAQLVVGRSVLQQQRDRTELVFERELIKQQSEIEKYQKLMTSDDAIIEAQSKVSTSMSSELTNGTATASDYTAQLNDESSAKLNKELHKIQLMLAILTYNTLKGN
ncbi:MAG: TolC family protein [Cyclobacteriaceae bacterium]|nr:TolC family protein [Cyclobacteriaceae bacterium]